MEGVQLVAQAHARVLAGQVAGVLAQVAGIGVAHRARQPGRLG